MGWERMLPLTELDPGQARAVGDLLLCRLDDGSVTALENCCSHADVPLGDQELENGQVRCAAHGARFQAPLFIDRVAHAGDKDHRDVFSCLVGFQGLADLDAVHFRHDKIHQNDIRLQDHCLVNGRLTSGRFSHWFNIRNRSQQRLQTLTKKGMIIGDQNANRFHVSKLPLVVVLEYAYRHRQAM